MRPRRERFGDSSLFLDGRIIMAQPLPDMRDKAWRSRFGQGERGSVMLRSSSTAP